MVSVLSQMNSVQILPSYFPIILSNILQSTLRSSLLSLPWSFPAKPLYALIYDMRATCHVHLILLLLITLTILKIMVLLIMQSSLSSRHFLPLFSSASSSQSSSVHILPLVWETKFRAHIKLQENYSSYTLIFNFLQRRKKRRLWTICNKNSLRLISSWMQLSYVPAIPTYLNFTTFSKDLTPASKLRFCPASGGERQKYTWFSLCLFLVTCNLEVPNYE
jgi:hypothetical protein